MVLGTRREGNVTSSRYDVSLDVAALFFTRDVSAGFLYVGCLMFWTRGSGLIF